MVSAHRMCCGCPCPASAFFSFLDEASSENTHSHQVAMLNLCSVLDEDVIHPYVANSVTGLNYGSSPNGTTRVGLEMFCNINDMDPGPEPTTPTCAANGYSGYRDLDHVVQSFENYGGGDYEVSDDLYAKIIQRFGLPRPFHPDVFSGDPPFGINPETYVNPYPKHIAFLCDDSGSHVIEDTIPTIRALEGIFTEDWGAVEVAKRFSVISCKGTPVESPIGFDAFTGVIETWTYPLYIYMTKMYPNQFL